MINKIQSISNPLIDLLPQYLAVDIRKSMREDVGSSDKLSHCRTGYTDTCCSEDSIEIFKSYLEEIIIPNKLS